MSRKRFATLLTLAACAACLARPAAAQLGSQDLPDLSGLAGAIEKSSQSPPTAPPKPAAPGTVYRSGLKVPSVHPGEGAQSLGHSLVETTVRQKAPAATITAMRNVEKLMPQTLLDFEAYMEKHGFAKRDFGVATGVLFAMNRETANHLTLSDAAEAAVIRSVSDTAASKYKTKFASMAPAKQEKAYETMLSGSLLLRTFAEACEKAGKKTEEASMRKAAGMVFTKVIGLAPDMVDISPEGRVTGPPPPPTSEGTVPPAASPADAPPADAPPADAPPAGPAQ